MCHEYDCICGIVLQVRHEPERKQKSSQQGCYLYNYVDQCVMSTISTTVKWFGKIDIWRAFILAQMYL